MEYSNKKKKKIKIPRLLIYTKNNKIYILSAIKYKKFVGIHCFRYYSFLS